MPCSIPLLAALLTITALAGCASASARAAAQTVRNEYIVSLDRPQTQTVDITYVLREIDRPLVEVNLPVWRPGRYQVLDTAGTIRSVSATNGRGEPVVIEKTKKSTWQIRTAGADEIRITYTVYANSLNDRTRHVDDSHAFLSGSAVFMFDPERRHEPCIVRIDAPAGWTIASGLDPAPGLDRSLFAPDYDVLVDSPIEVGINETIVFDVDGVPNEIVIWGRGRYDREKLAKDFAKIVRVESQIFGGLPYSRYVFLLHVAPGIGGGTEHLNSTIMQTSPNTFDDPKAYRGFLGLVAHEFFHTWNVKQFRPVGIKPYDYMLENYTDLLWVAEGSTSYYDDLCLVRAGLNKPDEYFKTLAGSIDSVRRSPGSRIQSLADSSFDAWIKFNRPTPDSPNSTVSFYTKGAMVSFALDMEIRRRTDNQASLDTVMRALYERFPYDGPGYSTGDLLDILRQTTGSDFTGFFEAHVSGTEPPDFESLVGVAGLELRRKPEKKVEDSDKESSDADESADDPPSQQSEKAYLGVTLKDQGGLGEVASVLTDGPAYDAGLIPGDLIVAMDGLRLRPGDLDKRLEKLTPGANVRLTFLRRDELRELTVVAAGRESGSLELVRVKEPTELQKAIYASWLGKPWPGAEPSDSAPAEAGGEADE